MTNKEEVHLIEIIKYFSIFVQDKYRKGAKEHGGGLLEYSEIKLLNEALAENVDQFVYLFTLKEKMMKRLENGAT